MTVTSCGKTRFDNRAAARRALDGIRRAPKGDGKKPVRVYPCPTCHGWHLTSEGR